jgi:N-acetylmuramoyl-L-alanine amidase
LIASRALLLSIAVLRFRICLVTALAFGAIIAAILRAEVNEQRLRDQSGETEPRAASSPKPKKFPTPTAKAKAAAQKLTKKHRPSATPRKTPTAKKARLASDTSPTEKSDSDEGTEPASTPHETPTPRASKKLKGHYTPTPKPKAGKKKSRAKETSGKTKTTAKSKSAPKEEETPKPQKTPLPRVEEERAASESATPPSRAAGAVIPAPAPQSKTQRAGSASGQPQVVIEKSGIEEDQGFEPPPSPPQQRGFWPWSRPASYRYLTSSVIEAIRRAPVKRRRWQFIVVHNSGTRQGNARVFDYYHRHVRRMQNGLAYHFVIGNGTSTGNGQIEVGDRWRRQINGGHVHSDYLNNISLGICLVGDFNRDQPTGAQLDACEELIRYLRERCGKTERGTIPVKPHREMNPPRWPTDCPGDDFPYSWFRKF